MTSNAGSNLNTNSIGFGGGQVNNNAIQNALKETFRPEFLNRVDEIVIFSSLSIDELMQIVDLMLNDTKKALEDKNITLEVTDSAKKYLLDKGTDTKYGARPLRRAIQRYVEDELSDRILRAELTNGNTVKIDFKDNVLSFEILK